MNFCGSWLVLRASKRLDPGIVDGWDTTHKDKLDVIG